MNETVRMKSKCKELGNKFKVNLRRKSLVCFVIVKNVMAVGDFCWECWLKKIVTNDRFEERMYWDLLGFPDEPSLSFYSHPAAVS